MSNFQSGIAFSEKLAEKRILKANALFGVKTVNRIIGIALFLLGGNREHISKFLKIPIGTLFSLLTRFHNSGVNAFVHQRKKLNQDYDKTVLIKPEINNTQPSLDIVFGEQKESIHIPFEKNKLIINASNQLQFKTIILSFMNSGFLTVKQASEILGFSERHVSGLNKKLQTDDITSLIDKRMGQQQDYVFAEDIKAELIQQFSANIMTGRSTSSREITKQVNQARNCNISDRAVRQYISKLGLTKIKNTLPNLLDELKKNSNTL